jgi:hypothetical protein
MKRQVTAVGLLLAGLALLFLGLTWNRLMPSSAYWGEDQAREYVAAQTDLHAVSHQHSHGSDGEVEFKAARERYDNISQQLESAQNSRSRTGTLLAVAGVLMLLGGIGLHWTGRESG